MERLTYRRILLEEKADYYKQAAGTKCPVAIFLPIVGKIILLKAESYKLRKQVKELSSWIYYNKLYKSRFQAGCLARRLEHDGWIYGYREMKEIEVYRSRKGKYGVRFLP